MAEATIDLSAPRRLHVVGVAGSGMSAIAEVLAAMGHHVSGSDLNIALVVDRLTTRGVEVLPGHDPRHLGGAEAVAVSTAIPPDNPEVVAARQRGIPVLTRAQVLAAMCRRKRTMAVAGTHGKTTTAAMLATILRTAGRRPSFVVGGVMVGLGTGARWDSGAWFVVEADESDGTFLKLPAEVAVVTSVEPDHLEHWGGFAPLVEGFGRFLQGARLPIVCADDATADEVGRAQGAVSYGFADSADHRITDYVGGRDGCRFAVQHGGGRVEVALTVPGRHNARNATAAMVAAAEAGVSPSQAAAALGHYQGVARRAQVRGERDGVTYVEEYAHLPGEVSAALAAALDGDWGRIVCVFQPHRFSRTAALWRDFARAFDGADVLAVTDIYPAGEPPRPGVTGKLVVDTVVDASPHRRVAWLPDRPGLVAFLRRELRPGDLCLVLTAGDLTSLPDDLLGGPSLRSGHAGP